MATLQILKRDGRVVRRPMRNCDTVANYADAKGKFKACGGEANYPKEWGFNRALAFWLMEEAKTEGGEA